MLFSPLKVGEPKTRARCTATGEATSRKAATTAATRRRASILGARRCGQAITIRDEARTNSPLKRTQYARPADAPASHANRRDARAKTANARADSIRSVNNGSAIPEPAETIEPAEKTNRNSSTAVAGAPSRARPRTKSGRTEQESITDDTTRAHDIRARMSMSGSRANAPASATGQPMACVCIGTRLPRRISRLLIRYANSSETNTAPYGASARRTINAARPAEATSAHGRRSTASRIHASTRDMRGILPPPAPWLP